MLSESDVISLIGDLDIDIDMDAVSADATFKSLGMDSLDVFTLLVEIEAKTGKKIPDEEVDNLETISAIVDYLS